MTGGAFNFSTSFNLTELTGLKAANLGQLLLLLNEVTGSSIYHHTHRFLQQHQYLSPEPPNDFANWITQILGERELGERLASIDIISFVRIRELRNAIIDTITLYLAEYPKAKERFANPGEEFYFMKSVSFVLPTGYSAKSLDEFRDILSKIAFDSLYFHVFEARLRLEKGANDFSVWFESLGETKLAAAFARLDPYTFTMEQLRGTMLRIVDSRPV